MTGASEPSLTLPGQMFVEAVLRHQRGEFPAAEALYRAILAIHPGHAESAYNLGVVLQTHGRIQEAAELYRHALAVRPDYVDALSNLGTALQDLGKPDEAIACYRRAIAIRPDFAMVYCNLGVALKGQGKLQEAVAAYQQAIALQPIYDTAYANLGASLLEMGDLERSLQACRTAVAQNPALVIAQCNLGACHKAMNHLEEAEAAYRKALALHPDFPEGHFSLAQILFLKGDLKAAWPEYEWRWKLAEYGWLQAIHGPFAQPRWQGEALGGKTILVHSEQGMGDTIQFARFLPEVIARGGKIVLAVHPPLLDLLSAIPGITVVPLDRAPFPAFDTHIPLLSLPLLFGTTIGTIPRAIPYLTADPARTARWAERIGGARCKVGIVWAGNPSQRGDRFRSPRLTAMAPLFDVPGIDFVSLQVGPGRADIEANPLPSNVLDLGTEIKDFADTAAIMANLDLMISSCTAPLHLAGALGIPVWGVVPFAPHFFWLLNREDSPWYPTLRLQRQDTPGDDWSGVVSRIARDLAGLREERVGAA